MPLSMLVDDRGSTACGKAAIGNGQLSVFLGETV